MFGDLLMYFGNNQRTIIFFPDHVQIELCKIPTIPVNTYLTLPISPQGLKDNGKDDVNSCDGVH